MWAVKPIQRPKGPVLKWQRMINNISMEHAQGTEAGNRGVLTLYDKELEVIRALGGLR